MKGRCHNPRDLCYRHYGGRGIVVSEEWRDNYSAFRDWSLSHGWKKGLELDRADNALGYSPANCRWVPHKENMRNMRGNRSLTAFGESKCVAEWADDPRCIAGYYLTWQRIHKLGWDAERAMTTPAKPMHKRSKVCPTCGGPTCGHREGALCRRCWHAS